MSQISPSVLKGISTLVPDEVNFICLVEYNDKQWYMAMGRQSFYFISENFDWYKDPSIPYKKLLACRLCSKRKTLMQLKLEPPSNRG